jgi:hypothetical protein
MHRWAQSQMFRSLAFYSSEQKNRARLTAAAVHERIH